MRAAEFRREKRPLLLSEFAETNFLPFIRQSSLDADTKRYYETGWPGFPRDPSIGETLDIAVESLDLRGAILAPFHRRRKHRRGRCGAERIELINQSFQMANGDNIRFNHK
jgi:hypothetical protein